MWPMSNYCQNIYTIHGVPKSVSGVNKNNFENFYYSEENYIFENPRHILIVWIYSGLNRVSVIRTGAAVSRKEYVCNIFTGVFAYFPHFAISCYGVQMRNLFFRLKYRLLKQCLLNKLHQFFPAIKG